MRYGRALGAVVAAVLSACSSQPPTLDPHEMARIHTLKIVYVEMPQELSMVLPAQQGGVMPAGKMFLIMPESPAEDLSGKYLGHYQDDIANLGARKRLFSIAGLAVALSPWHSMAQLEYVNGPVDAWQYTQDSGVDAVLFLKPESSLSPYGYDFYFRIHALLYVNPHNASSYLYDEQTFGDKYRVLIPGETAHETALDLHDVHTQQAVDIWFGDHAAQLHADIDSASMQISAGLVHYLGGNPALPPPQGE